MFISMISVKYNIHICGKQMELFGFTLSLQHLCTLRTCWNTQTHKLHIERIKWKFILNSSLLLHFNRTTGNCVYDSYIILQKYWSPFIFIIYLACLLLRSLMSFAQFSVCSRIWTFHPMLCAIGSMWEEQQKPLHTIFDENMHHTIVES